MQRGEKERPKVVRSDPGDECRNSVDAILARHGERRIDPEEFQDQFGSLLSDGEG